MEKSVGRSVLVLTERYYPERFLVNDLVAEWVKAGFRVRVLTQVPSYPRDTLYEGYPNKASVSEEGGVTVTRFKTVLGYTKGVKHKIANYLLFMMRSCILAMRECRYADTVFVYHTGPLTQALPLVIAKLIYRRRTVIWTQDVWPDAVFAYGFPDHGPFAVMLKAFVRFIYRFADEVVVSSPGFVDRLRPYMPKASSARYVPQWVPDEFLEARETRLRLEAHGTKFIFTGNLGTMQNLESLVLAFGRVDPERATLFLLGDGTMRAGLERLVEEKGIRNVRFLGSVGVSEVKACVEQCDFAVLSLKADRLIGLTIPAKFQTYLAAGRPLLAVTDGEVAKLVEREQLGILASPRYIDAIASAIREAYSSGAALRERWAGSMRSLLEKEYLKDHAVRQISDLVFR